MISATPTNSSIRVEFEKYKLANGLEVILSENHRLPVVAVNIWYHVGPANERPGRTGFAHLFEHMMFQGSKHVGDNQIKLLQAAGANGVNGTTGFDRTNYFETLPAEKLELGLWIESDRMAFLLETLTARNLANQRDVVRNERRERENSPYSLVEEELYRQLFPAGHPYHASIIGSHADIESVRLEDVREFCRQFYVPNNATLALVGDFSTADAKLLVEKYFGDIPSGSVPTKPNIAIPVIKSQKRVTVTDRVELPRVYKAWLSPLVYQPGDAAADALAHVLGNGQASRLYRALVREKQVAQDVAASNQSMQLGSVFLVQATAKPGVSLEHLERALDDELWALQSSGPTQEELDRARNTTLAQFVFGLEQVGGMSGVADRLNQYNHYTGGPDFFTPDWERYESLTADDIQKAAQQFTPESCVVVRGVPGPKALDEVPKRTDTEHDIEHKSDLSDQEWRTEAPLATRTTFPELPVPVSFHLSNGLRVLFLERRNIPGVVMRFITLAGGGQNPASLPGLSSFTADMLARGTTQRTQAQIAASFQALGAVWSTWSGPDGSGVNLRVLKKNLEPACEIFADVTLNPSFADEEIERLRRERLVSIAQGRDNPRFVAEQELLRALYGTAHPYGNPDIGTTESNQRVQKGDIVTHYGNAFKLGSAALIVAGDASVEEVHQLGEKYFGLPSGTSISTAPSVPVRGPKRVVVVDRPGSPQTQLLIGQVGTVRTNPDYVAIELMNMILGGMFSSRINHNLREIHGYTYGASSQFAYRRYAGPFTISTAVRTDATVDAVKQIFEEVDRMREILPSSEGVIAAREAVSRSLISRFDTLASSAGSMGELFTHNLDLDHFRATLAQISTINGSDILRAANQYLEPPSMTAVAVGDASKFESELEQLRKWLN